MIEWVKASDDELAEIQAINAMVSEVMSAQPTFAEVGAEATRQARIDGTSWMGPIAHYDKATTRTIDTAVGPLNLRVILPEEASSDDTAPGQVDGRPVDAVFLHIHGGGWVLGAADQQDALLASLAAAANVAVVSIDYRLAPEHPFPAAPDDCEAAALWLVDNAAAEFGTDRLIIGGESAGAHLAVLTLLRLRERQDTVAPFVAANLVFGAFDLSQTPSTRNWGEEVLVLSTSIMAWFGECFTPGMTAEQRRDPAVSPLYADLHDLVPALFTVGSADPLLDDSLFMGTRWKAAGNDAEVVVYPEGAHGFIAFPGAISTKALERIFAFVAANAKP